MSSQEGMMKTNDDIYIMVKEIVATIYEYEHSMSNAEAIGALELVKLALVDETYKRDIRREN